MTDIYKTIERRAKIASFIWPLDLSPCEKVLPSRLRRSGGDKVGGVLRVLLNTLLIDFPWLRCVYRRDIRNAILCWEEERVGWRKAANWQITYTFNDEAEAGVVKISWLFRITIQTSVGKKRISAMLEMGLVAEFQCRRGGMYCRWLQCFGHGKSWIWQALSGRWV